MIFFIFIDILTGNFFNETRSTSPVSLVPFVLLNPEDSHWIEMLQEIGDKSMRNKCYYIVLKNYDNVNKMTMWERGESVCTAHQAALL